MKIKVKSLCLFFISSTPVTHLRVGRRSFLFYVRGINHYNSKFWIIKHTNWEKYIFGIYAFFCHKCTFSAVDKNIHILYSYLVLVGIIFARSRFFLLLLFVQFIHFYFLFFVDHTDDVEVTKIHIIHDTVALTL